MPFEQEQRAARKILDGIELGTMGEADSYSLLSDADPTFVYMLFAWLRANYTTGHPAAEGVIGRIVAICTAYPSIPRMAKQGGSDAIVEWFEETYDYADLEAEEFIALVVEKLEG